MRILRNYVLIEVDYKQINKTTKSGIYICGDDGYDYGRHTERYGKVVLLPERLYFDVKKQDISVEFDVPVECEIGDKVYFTLDSIPNSHSIEDDGARKFFIRYDNLLAKEVDGKLYPLNAKVLLKNVKEKNHSLGIEAEINAVGKAEVVYLGCKCNRYLYTKTDDLHTDMEVGDIVTLHKNYFMNLNLEERQYASEITKDLFWCNRKDIIAIT